MSGCELTKLQDISDSEADAMRLENIPFEKVGRGSREGWEAKGRKKSRKSCGGIGPTKYDDISVESHRKVVSRSSYLGWNRFVVVLRVCTGVPGRGKLEGGVTGLLLVDDIERMHS